MKVPIIDLKRQYATIKPEIDKAVQKVLDHGLFIMGPELDELEKSIADYCGVKYGIGVASGTDALLISLRALDAGPGTEVVTTTFSFFATAGVITRLGAKPVFVDVDPRTFNMDPKRLEAAITSKTRAIIPVHLYGQIAEMDEIIAIADKKNVPIVEDAAQAIGAKYKNKSAGQFGTTGCFSFFPTKNLGAYGDAGLIVTNDDSLNELIRKLRVHGAQSKYYHSIVGYNSRLDSIQAAVLNVKFNHLSKWHEARRQWAFRYNDDLKDIPEIMTPLEQKYNYHIYHQYTLIAENRDKLRDYLRENGIGSDTYYPLPLHLQECYKDLGYKKGDLPVAERLAGMAISLPVFPEMTAPEHDYVCDTIREFYKKK